MIHLQQAEPRIRLGRILYRRQLQLILRAVEYTVHFHLAGLEQPLDNFNAIANVPILRGVPLYLLEHLHVARVVDVNLVALRHCQDNVSFVDLEALRADGAQALFVPHFQISLNLVLAASVSFLVLDVVLSHVILAIERTSLEQDNEVIEPVANLILVALEAGYLVLDVDRVQNVRRVVDTLVRDVVVNEGHGMVRKCDHNVLIAVVSEENGKICDGHAVEVVAHVLDLLNFSFAPRDWQRDHALITLEQKELALVVLLNSFVYFCYVADVVRRGDKLIGIGYKVVTLKHFVFE